MGNDGLAILIHLTHFKVCFREHEESLT